MLISFHLAIVLVSFSSWDQIPDTHNSKEERFICDSHNFREFSPWFPDSDVQTLWQKDAAEQSYWVVRKQHGNRVRDKRARNREVYKLCLQYPPRSTLWYLPRQLKNQWSWHSSLTVNNMHSKMELLDHFIVLVLNIVLREPLNGYPSVHSHQ